MNQSRNSTASIPLTIKQRLAAGDTLIGAVINMVNTTMVEVCGAVGFDFLFLDWEHGLKDHSDMVNGLIAAELSGVPALVRVGERSANFVARVLDAGAAGILFPHVSSASEAEELVSWCRYKPDGVRGSGLSRGFLRHNGTEFERRQSANDDVVCMMIVEDLEGASNLSAILAVEGVTGVAIGPGDISMELGAASWQDPTVTAVLADMAEIASAVPDRALLRLCLTPDDAPALMRSGANMLLVTHDVHLIKEMYRSLLTEIVRRAGTVRRLKVE